MELIYAYIIGCWIITLGCLIPVLFYMKVDGISWEYVVISLVLLIFSPIIISGVILGLLGMTIYKCLKKK